MRFIINVINETFHLIEIILTSFFSFTKQIHLIPAIIPQDSQVIDMVAPIHTCLQKQPIPIPTPECLIFSCIENTIGFCLTLFHFYIFVLFYFYCFIFIFGDRVSCAHHVTKVSLERLIIWVFSQVLRLQAGLDHWTMFIQC